MTNLLRLADSHLLLDGFEEFVRHWLDDPQPVPVPEPTEAQRNWLKLHAPEVEKYWQMVHRWPGASLDGAQDSFVGLFVTREDWEVKNVPLVYENQGCWTISWNSESKDLWCGDADQERIDITISHFLVTFGLYNLVVANWGEVFLEPGERVSASIEAQSNLIWEGPYHPGQSFEFFYLGEKSLLWYHDSYDFTIFGSTDPSTEDWLLEQLRNA